ncbi:hypothetical protein, partial [Lacticaseibacillus nasuensis]|uniref:hypothetical protein n=1 Tax=Lacticaseibacillus nasuensis TaxID=944671 RepID=UPI000A8CB3B7
MKAKLQTILAEPTSSTDEITTATQAYNAAITKAKADRDAAETAGDNTVAGATTAGVAQDGDVATAIKAYHDTVAGADAETKTSAEVAAAAKAVQTAIDAATAARAVTVPTAPYALDDAVA